MKIVLLTGGAGAVGSALVPELLRDPALRLVLLLRAAPEQTVAQRYEDLKVFWSGYGLPSSVWERVEVLEGDVSREWLGLPRDVYGGLVRNMTHFIHGAAEVRLNMTEADARQSSVATTVHALRLAEEALGLEKLEYISTVGVAGARPGVIPERRIVEPRVFHNTYESSKAEAEDLVWKAMDRGLPVTIHRPSMVVGDSRDGKTRSFQVFYHLMEFLSGRATAGWVPRLPPFRLDVVPNDYVARAIATSLHRPLWAGQVLHLSAGGAGSLLLDRLVVDFPALLSRAGLETPTVRRFPWGLFKILVSLAATLGPRDRRKSFRHLPRFLSYLQETMIFDNQNARRLLGEEGVPLPSLEDILPVLVSSYVSHRKTAAALRPSSGPTRDSKSRSGSILNG